MADQETFIGVLSAQREKVGEIPLPAVIAEQPPREHLLFETVRMQLANRRSGTAATKTRAQVRGGGRNLGAKKEQGGRVREVTGLQYGSVEQRYLVPSHVLMRTVSRAQLGRPLCGQHSRRSCAKTSWLSLMRFNLMSQKQSRWSPCWRNLRWEIVSCLSWRMQMQMYRNPRAIYLVKVLLSEGLNVYDILRYRQVLVTQAAMQRISERLGGE